MNWRTKAARVIAKVIQEVGTDDLRALRRALSAAYPFGRKEQWPYKVWLSEIKRQLDPTPAGPETPDGPLVLLMKDEA